jgi:acyl-CoA reductase-like NAD-dependent aldehyde dehydrogenase
VRSQAKLIEVISPHTEQSIAEAGAAGPADVDDNVNAARTRLM